MKPPPFAPVSVAERQRERLIAHLATAEPTAEAMAIAAVVPDAVWPWEIRLLALIMDFYAIEMAAR